MPECRCLCLFGKMESLFYYCRDQAIIHNSVAVVDVLGRSANNRLIKILTRNNTQISAHTFWGIFHITKLAHLIRYIIPSFPWSNCGLVCLPPSDLKSASITYHMGIGELTKLKKLT